MFTLPQHILDIHRRQVLEWTRAQTHTRSPLAPTASAQRPTTGRALFGRLRALLPYPAAPQAGTSTSALTAQE